MSQFPPASDVAMAFIASTQYLEFVGRILAALEKVEWEVVEYDHGYSSVIVYSWPRPAHVEMRFDIGEATARRRESISFGVATRLADDIFGLPFMCFWSERYPTLLRPGVHEEFFREVALVVAEDFRARLTSDANYVRGIDALLALLASPEVIAESRRRREEYAAGRLLEGLDVFRRMGWTEGEILAKVQGLVTDDSA